MYINKFVYWCDDCIFPNSYPEEIGNNKNIILHCKECNSTNLSFYCIEIIDSETNKVFKRIYPNGKIEYTSKLQNLGNPKIKCTYCSSENVHKISTTSRIFSTSILGINSNKLGKQWHCNNCGSNF